VVQDVPTSGFSSTKRKSKLEGTPVVGALENMNVYLDDTGVPGGRLQSQCSD